MKKRLLTAFGFAAVTLGTVGIFVPILPTTPFLLLAAWLFMKGNPRWREWLINHRYLGIYIKNYLDNRAIPLRAKTVTIATLWVTITISILLIDLQWVKLLLLFIATAVTVHLLLLKTLK